MLGTVDRKAWKAGLAGAGPNLDEALKHMADFKHVLTLERGPRRMASRSAKQVSASGSEREAPSATQTRPRDSYAAA